LVQATAKLIPNADYAEMAGAGHLPCAERPQEYAAILVPFMRRVLNL
jgi:3-oxoadipate enol-lactonase